MKILITGSHFTVAQAVIEELQRFSRTSTNSATNIEIVYVGRKNTLEGDKTLSVESQVLPKKGVRFIPITTGRLRRYLSFQTLISLLKIPVGFIQSFSILLKERPDIVVSFGGYVGVPVVFCAWLLSIPILIHEQTLVSGLANRISSLFADKIAVTFDIQYDFPKSKIVVTGNPMRKEVLSPVDVNKDLKEFVDTKKSKPLILITGGNQGSHAINEVVNSSLDELTETAFVVHQTGDSEYHDFEKLSQKKSELKNSGRYFVSKWLDASSMGYLMRNADLAISRAGANTLLELAYFSVPSIIIPIDYISRNEQNVNARFFKNLGLCEILSQKNLTKNALLTLIRTQLENIKIRKEEASSAKKMVLSDSAKILSQQILILLHQNV